MNLGIIGLGEHITRSHLIDLEKNKDVNIVGYFDPGVLLHQKYKRFDSFQELLESEIDTVIIGSPDQFHAQQLLDSVRAGKNVFVEKPLAITPEGMEKVREALELAEDNGLMVTSCHPRRFDPPIIWVKNYIYTLDVQFFSFRFLYHKATDQWKKSRSLMLDHLGHEIDLFNFFFPEHKAISKKQADSSHYYQVKILGAEKTANQVTLECEFVGHRILEEKKYWEWIDIVERDGKATSINLNTGRVYCDGKEIIIPEKNYDVMFQGVNNNFVNSVLKREKNYLTFEDLITNNKLGITLKEKIRNRFSEVSVKALNKLINQ